ncbi:unnamed protein product [Paramecium octaurelia]|uniref:Protein kinase domain-containing protein n=1 Tax=Paramecium octaurelia TaxID=43137 RepID=A0A8S1UJG2_PAROT|nr:unnamed protein product [Paramecium octaurelia]
MDFELTKDQFYSQYKPFQKLNLNDQPFTKQYISEKRNETVWIKKRRIQGEYKDYFIKEIRKEIQIQKTLYNNNPEWVLRIKNFTIFTSQGKNRETVMIAYYNDQQCAQIFKYIKNQQNRGCEINRIDLSNKLFDIYQQLRKNKVWHQNIKPNNVFYYDGQILLSDFGSNRTFHQNYIQQFNSKKEQNWQKEYYFYNPKIILELIKNYSDYDMRRYEFDELKSAIERQKQFEDVLNVPQNSFNLDSWAIGVIIIQIFYPKDFMNPDINTYYAFDTNELKQKIQGITKIDQLLGKRLEMLFYPEVQQQEIIEQTKNKLNVRLNISQIFQQNYLSSQLISVILPENLDPQTNNPVVNPQPNGLPSYSVTCQAKVAKYETGQAMDKFLQVVQKQIHPELKKFQESTNEEKLKYVLDFHILIQLDLKEVQSYLNDLNNLLKEFSSRAPSENETIQQSHNNNIEKLKENIFPVQNRECALLYFYNYEMEPPEEDIIYYYNLKEATIIQWKKQFQIPQEQTKQNTNNQAKPYFSPEKIADLIKLRKKELKIEANVPVMLKNEQLKIISFHYLKTLPQYQNILEKKKQQKEIYGAEEFPFNLALRTRLKVQNFIKKKEKEYLLELKEYESISEKLKNEYLTTLFSCIDTGISRKQDVQIFIRGVNYVYPPLIFKCKDKYAVIKLRYEMLPSELCKEIQIFFQQKYSVTMKVEYKYLQYLKVFGTIQNQKSYIGYLVNGKHHGQGFKRINQEKLQFGIFKYGQLIWGWEIVKKDKKILVYKGEFQNGSQFNRGIIKEFEKEENGGQTIFRKLNRR